jgi:hypothetical protein
VAQAGRKKTIANWPAAGPILLVSGFSDPRTEGKGLDLSTIPKPE